MTFLCFQGTAALFPIQEFNTFNSLYLATVTGSFHHLVALVFLDFIFSPPSMKVSLIADLAFASPWTVSSLSVEKGTVSFGLQPREKR